MPLGARSRMSASADYRSVRKALGRWARSKCTTAGEWLADWCPAVPYREGDAVWAAGPRRHGSASEAARSGTAKFGGSSGALSAERVIDRQDEQGVVEIPKDESRRFWSAESPTAEARVGSPRFAEARGPPPDQGETVDSGGEFGGGGIGRVQQDVDAHGDLGCRDTARLGQAPHGRRSRRRTTSRAEPISVRHGVGGAVTEGTSPGACARTTRCLREHGRLLLRFG